MEGCFYVINDTVQERHLNVGTREVWFNRAGHSAALTEGEYTRLMTIPGFRAAGGPPHIEEEVDQTSGTKPCPLCAGLGRVTADIFLADAWQDGRPVFFPEPDLTADLGDAPALPLEFEAPEEEPLDEELIAYPPPPEVPVPVALADEEIADWQGAAVPRRIAWVEENHFDAEQLLSLFNTEAAGKNSPRVLAAIETRRSAVLNNRTAFDVNAALIAANVPTLTEE